MSNTVARDRHVARLNSAGARTVDWIKFWSLMQGCSALQECRALEAEACCCL